MKLSILTLGACVNAQGFGEEEDNAVWSSWTPWQTCSQSCGNGTRTRLRACTGGLSWDACQGQSVQTGNCNDGPCPTWSNWGSWGDCSENCGGGLQSRTRSCTNGEEGDCPGSNEDEQICNARSCDREMIFWRNQISWGQYTAVQEQYLPAGDTLNEQCASYCLSFTGCYGIAVTYYDRSVQYNNGQTYDIEYRCYISTAAYTRGPNCWGTACNGGVDYQGLIFGVFQDYYESNPEFLPTTAPDGTVGTNYEEVEGLCDKASTGFGDVDYRNTNNVEFSSYDNKNVIRESGSNNCAARCFEKAGCSAFYVGNSPSYGADSCTMIIGNTNGGSENDDVTDSGMLHNLCQADAFQNSFTRRSQFYCLFFAPNQSSQIAQNIIQRNNAGNFPMETWRFETRSNNPYVTFSQYISVTMSDTSGSNARYRPVYFNVETHVRTGESSSSRRRRSLDEIDFTKGGMFTEKSDLKAHKQAIKYAKQVDKQRAIQLRTDDFIAEVAAIEEAATSFILGGNLDLPDDVEVAATGPVEVVEFTQRASDGSVAADCASGTCECSAGFIDNGDGCEEMTEEEAATTQAPTTTTVAPTQAESSVADFLTSLVAKMNNVFEDNKEGGRPHLTTKWEKITTKFANKYARLVANDCSFADSWEDNSVDMDNVNTCRDIVQVTAAVRNWGAAFTMDCNKVEKGTESKWFDRVEQQLQRIAQRTQNRLGC